MNLHVFEPDPTARPAENLGDSEPGTPLGVHTLISAATAQPISEDFHSEAQALHQQVLASGTCSVAELAAICHVPLDAARTVIADLAADGYLTIHPPAGDSPADHCALLTRILVGLSTLE